MGESNGRFNGVQHGPTRDDKVAKAKRKHERLSSAQTLMLQWMRSHEAPEIKSIDDPDVLDFLALLIRHVLHLEQQLDVLMRKCAQLPDPGERRIVLPGETG